MQLRRKEGENLKKIAVYEQKIDQMTEQIEEFREREESTKSMYDKILEALNNANGEHCATKDVRFTIILITIELCFKYRAALGISIINLQ